jgi:hypothetical protein
MSIPRQFLALAAFCGAVALLGWNVDKFGFPSLTIGDTETAVRHQDAAPGAISSSIEPGTVEATLVTGSLGDMATAVPDSTETKVADVSAAVEHDVETASLDSPSPLPPAAPVRLTSAFVSKAVEDEPLPSVRPLEAAKECLETPTCIDDYLWAVYERTPKVDTNRVTAKIKKTVKKAGKLRTILATITNYVVGDFTWKDPAAARRLDKPTKDYVIGGMDPGFKLKLYRALRIMDDAGLMPGITSAFRDNYRQSIAEGNKAASDSSYHGGSRRGGFGHGLAADLVSVKGETRAERYAASEALWKWIDAHEKELAIGRPYRDRDPPHVGPLDGKEYADKRGLANAQKAAAAAAHPKPTKTARAETKKHGLIARHGARNPARPEKPSKLSSVQPATTAQASKLGSLQTAMTVER